MKTSFRPLTLIACGAMIAATSLLPQASAEEPVATALDVVDAADYVGKWTLGMDFNGNQVEMGLTVVAIDGKIGATIDSSQQPEPVAATEATADESGLSLTYPMDFGGNSLTLNLKVRNVDGVLSGTLAEASGLFTADLTGVKATSAEEANAGDGEGERPQRRRGRGGLPSTKLTIDGKAISINFAQLKADGEDYETFSALGNGDLFKFVGGRAIKLRTELSLKFGDTVIKTGNAAANYPGVYSMWLKKKSGNEWTLVFNEHADIWGTQHLPEADVAEIPIAVSEAAEASDTFKIELKEEGNGGTLNIVWGKMAWQADFTTVAQ